jgi:quinohemoprotein ethanol dehydrogenase
VWKFNTGLGVIAHPITYEVGGTQYLAVLVGYGGNIFAPKALNAGWKYHAQTRRMLVFALGGKVALPPQPPADMQLHALDDPAIKIVEADVVQGRDVFNNNCALCHGVYAISNDTAGPDLRESPVALDRDTLWSVLHDGTLMEHGMPRFEKLTRDQVEKLYIYIRAAAREALGLRKPPNHVPAASPHA